MTVLIELFIKPSIVIQVKFLSVVIMNVSLNLITKQSSVETELDSESFFEYNDLLFL